MYGALVNFRQTTTRTASWQDLCVAWGDVRSGRALDRLINFSDAVVSVAVTVLALPVVDIPGPTNGQTIWDVLIINSGRIQLFVMTFLVVSMLWGVHNRIVNNLGSYDTAIFFLTILWLLGFAFLPWPSRLSAGPGLHFEFSGAATGDAGGAGVLYWLTLAYIAFIGTLTAGHMRRHPDLIDPAALGYWTAFQSSRARWRGAAFTAVFVLAAIASHFIFWLGSFILILAIPLAVYLRPPSRKA